MKREQTELIDFFINPSFLEQLHQPLDSISVSCYHSFNIIRNGKEYHITMYTGKNGQVNISDVNKYGSMGNTILRDFCQTMDDFKRMIEKLDDLADRFPTISTE